LIDQLLRLLLDNFWLSWTFRYPLFLNNLNPHATLSLNGLYTHQSSCVQIRHFLLGNFGNLFFDNFLLCFYLNADPFQSQRLFIRTEAGGVFVMKVKDLSA
jgi:hypothetical protein